MSSEVLVANQIQYANVMGMQKDIKMHGNQFSWGATAFFLAYTFAELPQGMFSHLLVFV